MNAIWGSVRKPCLSLFLFLSLLATGAFGQAIPLVASPVDNAQRVTLSGSVHPLARPEYDRGAADSGLPMGRILLLLKRSDAQEAALQTYMEQQQDKSSPNYQAWLTPAQFGALYGPADSDIQAITQWLSSQGFTVNKVYTGKTVIEFSGTVAQVQAAFGTSIHNFQVNGKMYVANATNPQIPAALTPVITGIVSLNNFPRQSHVRVAGQARKIAGQPKLQPLFTFPISGQSTDFYGLGPADFATIYNSQGLITAGNNGSGQTIAIVGETDINVADVQAFRQMFGLSSNFSTSNVILNGEDPGITSQGEEIEADLDVQWSGAVAPGATIDYVVSESTPASAGIDLSALYIIEYNLAGVMSESYGACESFLGTTGNAFYNTLWEQAAAQGITAVLSAGDGGSAGCDDFSAPSPNVAQYGLAVSGLASTPYNVAVGGTDFDDVNKWSTYWSANNNSTTGESALSYIPEIPWNENCTQIGLTGCTTNLPNDQWLNIVAGSGGASTTYNKPNWQIGMTGMPNDSHRDLPDVSLFASPGFDNSGYVICAGDGTTITGPSQCNATPGVYNVTIVGGTSASTPAFAGIMALVNQKQSGTQQGNPNPALYALAKKSSCTSTANEAAGCIFNDITHGNSYLPTGGTGVGTNSVPCQGGTPNCSEAVASENGVLVEPTNSQIEAYTVNTGYDLVTGLGSVNIANLATNWSTVNTVPTTTTLTLSPLTGITHGFNAENVTVNITVTPTSGTATGNVSLIATGIAGPNGATTQGLNEFPLVSGKVVNATTNSLPGGTNYQVHAHYSGDGTNAPSDSTPVTVTVSPESSQTFIVVPTYDNNGNLVSGNATSVTYGSLYILTMYVTDKNAVASTSGPPTPACFQENILTCPTGTVSLTDGGSPLGTGRGGSGTYYLNSAGHTENLTLNLTGGTHTLVATYSGDNSYQGSASASTNLTVTPAATVMNWFTAINRIPMGAPFQLTLEVVGQGPLVSAPPSGTVTFYDGSQVLAGTVQLDQLTNGVSYATISCPGLSVPGLHNITAQYGGDQNYGPSTTGNVIALTVQIPTALTLSASASTINYGQSITLTAVMTGTAQGPPITGQIMFGASNWPITVTSTTNGVASNGDQTLTVVGTVTPPGTLSASAYYQGDQNYEASTSNSVNVSVTIPDFSVGPSAGLTVVPSAGQSASGQISVTPATQTASTVALVIQPPLPTFEGYSVIISPQQVNLSGSAATATLTVAPSTSSTNSVPSNVLKSRTRHAAILALDRNSWLLSGLMTALGVILVLTLPGRRKKYRMALGLTALSLIFLALGCGGGGGGGGGGGAQSTTVTITTSNTKVTLGTAVTISATVTGNSPTGTVTLYDADGTQCCVINLVNGQGQTAPITFSSIGVYQITADYSGDSKNEASKTASPLAQAITGTVTATIMGTTGTNTHSIPLTVGIQ